MVRNIVLIICLVFVGILDVNAGSYNINFDNAADYTYDSNKLNIAAGKVKFKSVGGVSWWNTSYKYRQKLTITTGANLSIGTSVPLNIDTSSLESKGNVRADRKDWKIVRHSNTNGVVDGDGTNIAIVISDAATLRISDPLTLETFINFNGTVDNGGIIDRAFGAGNRHIFFEISNGLAVYFAVSADGTTNAFEFFGSVPPATGWHHIAAVADGSQARIYIDGVLDASASYTGPTFSGTAGFDMSINGGTVYGVTNAYYDEVRISNVARYTGSSFTVPSVPFRRDSNTVLLLHFDAPGSTTQLDDSNNNHTVVENQAGSIVTNFPSPASNIRELEREYKNSSQTWIKLQTPLNNTTDSTYYVYYGYSNEAQSPITYTHTTEASSTTVTNADEEGQTYYTSATVVSKVINLSSNDTKLSGFGEIATKTGGTEIYYQLSLDGTNWVYWDSSKWSSAGSSNYNTAKVVNSNINKLSITGAKLYIKAFLVNPNGTGQVDLDKVYLTGSLDAELEIISPDDALTKIVVPAYISDKLLQFSITSATIPTSNSEKKQALVNYEFKAIDVETLEEVKRFDKALTITMHWKSTDGIYIDGITERIKVDDAKNRLKLAFWNGIYWVMLDSSVSVINNNKDVLVSGKTSHLSQFAVVVKPASDEVKINVAPNPFTPKASQYNRVLFTFANTDSEQVEVLIYDITGRLVRTIVDNSGTSSISWDGKDEYGEYVEGGVYIYQLKIGGKRAGKGTIVVAY